jgi:uncharacterized protein
VAGHLGLGRAAALAAALVLASPTRAELPVPALTGPVVDQAGLLSRAEVAQLESLARAARETHGGGGPQLQFLIVPTLEGEPIESFTLRVVEAWKLGAAARDDGVLVAVASQDRQVRIEVGGGLEGGLTDAQSSRIIRNTLVPAFRDGRYGAGLHDAGVQILAALGSLPEGVARPQPTRPAVRFPVVGFLVFLVVTSILRGFLGFGRRRRRHLWWGGGPWLGGGWGGGSSGLGGGGGGWSGGGGGFSGGGASGRW